MRGLLAIGLAMLLAAPASATIYGDSTGDIFTGAGGGILDIVSVEVTNDATDINFTFTLAGDILATDWGKYMVIMDDAPGGDPLGNGWARPISMPSGADHWLGSWVDSGNGAELYSFGGSWSLVQATYNPPPDISISKTQFTVTLTTQLAALGLGIGDSFLFDAFTSGGGGSDGAIDSLGNPGVQVGDWGQPSEAHPVSYTVVPEPGTFALVGLAALSLMRRRQ